MDRSRAKRIVTELSGKALGAWPVGRYIDNGKSAVVAETVTRDLKKAALKIFDPDLVEQAGQEVQLARIQREKSLIGKIHPHLIGILDGGWSEEQGYFFVVMDYCPGETIASTLKKIPPQNIKIILSHIASAAHFLENQTPRLAHRDIKPENVRLKDDLSYAVLLDLGVTKPIGGAGATDQENKHPFLGTRRYSPPEFLQRREKNTIAGWRAVTFYQLGAVLHDMLMRKPLFDAYEPEANLIEAILHTVPEVHGMADQQDLVQLCRSCLHKDPEVRLKLVDWSRFEVRPTSADDVALLKTRISALQSGHNTASVPHNPDSEARDALRQITSSVENQIRNECVAAGFFPPHTIHKLASKQPRAACLRVSFPQQRALPFAFTLTIQISLLDLRARTVALTYHALGTTGQLPQDFDEPEFQQFFAGPYDEQAFAQPLRTFLYTLYERAITPCVMPTAGKPVRIALNLHNPARRKRS